MKNKRLAVILSSILSLSLLTTAFAETPEANLQRNINESKALLQTNPIAGELVNSLIKLSNSLVRFEQNIIVEPLKAPAGLKVENDILSWNADTNAESYEIVITNTKTNIEQKFNTNQNTKDLSSLIDFDIEYFIKIKAIAQTNSNYIDSPYSTELGYTKAKVQLNAPTELSIDSKTNILTWKQVENAQDYEIVITNTQTNIEQKFNTSRNIKDLSSLIDVDIKYSIKIKAIAQTNSKYKDSKYSAELEYTKQGTVPPENLKAPVITSLGLEDIISRKVSSYQSDLVLKLALNLKWDYTGDDSFIVNITEGTNTKQIPVKSGQRELRLNQYITKSNTNYTISMVAKNSSTESTLSNTKTYSAKSVCGHDNGFMFVDNYVSEPNKAYAVSTPEQFEHILFHGNSLNDILVQTNDIDFNNKKYTNNIVPVIIGPYDGQGFMVDNFEIEGEKTGATNIGVFGNLSSNITMKDFGVGPKAVITGYTGCVGGITGYGYASFYRCYNYATIKSDGNAIAVGGITGRSIFNLQDCYNAGTIISNGNETAAGGLVGISDVSGDNRLSIINCYNSGTVTSKAAGGGLEGYSKQATPLNVKSSYNTGKISGADAKTGGLLGVGQIKAINTALYYLNTSATTGGGGVGTAKTDNEMKSNQVVTDLNKNNANKYIKTSNYSYPELTDNLRRNFE